MGKLSEFSFSIRLFLKTYKWRRIDPVPWTPLVKPLSECNVALVTSAGLVMPEQDHFDESMRGGDPSFREIRGDVDVSTLIDTHRSESFDHTGMEKGSQRGVPLGSPAGVGRARERIGSVNHRHLSLMGSITAPGRFIKNHAPEAAEHFVADGVDVALLVPV